MKYKTAELAGDALDYLAHCARHNEPPCLSPAEWAAGNDDGYSPSTNWDHGGRIIERERIEVRTLLDRTWIAEWKDWANHYDPSDTGFAQEGTTYLIAAMRAFVASRFGDEIELP